MQHDDTRGASSTAPEDLFVDLFAQAFGPEKALFLSPQHPVTDIYGTSRFVDLALRARGEKIAFEIDGLPWHVPEVVTAEKYEDDLLRQNSLVHFGWCVFRWTDRQIAHNPEQVKEQLALFLEHVPQLLAFEDFLPRQSGEVLALRDHQEDALRARAHAGRRKDDRASGACNGGGQDGYGHHRRAPCGRADALAGSPPRPCSAGSAGIPESLAGSRRGAILRRGTRVGGLQPGGRDSVDRRQSGRIRGKGVLIRRYR